MTPVELKSEIALKDDWKPRGLLCGEIDVNGLRWAVRGKALVVQWHSDCHVNLFH
jgi:hypothetical protein